MRRYETKGFITRRLILHLVVMNISAVAALQLFGACFTAFAYSDIPKPTPFDAPGYMSSFDYVPILTSSSTEELAQEANASKPYVFVKGGEIYADFAGLPDFIHYVKLDDKYVVAYPTYSREFYYLGHSDVKYIYKTKIYDYITDNMEALEQYKETLPAIGFKALAELKNDDFWDYVETIEWELRYDPDFRLDSDGVFIAEWNDTFRLLLIGRSVTCDSTGELMDCIEFRFYSLSRNDGDMLNLISTVGTLNDMPFNKTIRTSYYTPGALGDIRDISTNNTPTFYYTPDVLGDVLEIPSSNVKYLY